MTDRPSVKAAPRKKLARAAASGPAMPMLTGEWRGAVYRRAPVTTKSARAHRTGSRQKGISGAIRDLHEAKPLFGIVPFHGGLDGRTGRSFELGTARLGKSKITRRRFVVGIIEATAAIRAKISGAHGRFLFGVMGLAVQRSSMATNSGIYRQRRACGFAGVVGRRPHHPCCAAHRPQVQIELLQLSIDDRRL